jgi:4-amino-4-deoxy-L-arabinose transferase-like glycosyltransferase
MLEFVLYPPPEIARTPPPPRSRNGNSNGHHPATPAAPPRKSPPRRRLRTPALLSIFALWLAIFFASLWTPPLLDDADATHAQAAQSMLQTADWVTLHVDGVRYLEKAPLPYWMAAISLGVFGRNSFAIHLPLALTVLALAMLGFVWSRRAFGERAALYTAVFLLTSTGVFLFTRIFIPDALLSLLLALSLYCLLRALEPATNSVEPTPISVILSGASQSYREAQSKDPDAPRIATTARTFQPSLYAYLMWTALALAVLAKGLVALVFFFGAAAVFLPLAGELRHWRRLRPFTGVLLLLAIAAPWHILAGLRNTGGEGGHGFFWFYFVNEHLLRFLGRRIPRDYNKLPTALYWSLHLVWLFPWSLFAPAAILTAWRRRRQMLTHPITFSRGTILLLVIFSALVLVFFSLSTNQEYYTFPVYLPLLILLAAALSRAERTLNPGPWALHPTLDRLILAAYITFTLLGLAIALALGYGLWTSRHLPFNPDIGSLLAHRGIGDYTLSMSHFFDLTGPSFAALRLPALIAALAFALGPALAWTLYHRRRLNAALMTVAITNATFLLAAHLAFTRFAPILSSQNFAARILTLEQQHEIAPDTQVLLFGDQSFGSSIPFYLNRRVFLVDGRSTSMLFGSTFPDMPPVFLSTQQLLAEWGHGPRKILFVPAERRADADRLLGPQIILAETSGKLLLTDRPLPPSSQLDSSKLEAQQNPASNK